MQVAQHCPVRGGRAHAHSARRAAAASELLVRQAATLVVGLMLLTAGAPTQASETFRLCGPESAGFVRAGRQITCLGGSLDWRRRPRRAASAAPTANGTAPAGATQSVAGMQQQER